MRVFFFLEKFNEVEHENFVYDDKINELNQLKINDCVFLIVIFSYLKLVLNL